MEIHANALQQFDQRLRAFRQCRFGESANAVQPVIRHDVNGVGSRAMPYDVEESAGLGLCRGEPCCYT